MAIPGWQEELIQAAAKWPRGFRACLRAGIWELLGAPDTVQQEFRQWAERISHELHFPHSGPDPVSALLNRLQANGHYVRSSRRSAQRGKAASQEVTILPLQRALIRYLSGGWGANPKSKRSAGAPPETSGQSAATKENRIRTIRMAILAALQELGCLSEAPSFVRQFHDELPRHPFSDNFSRRRHFNRRPSIGSIRLHGAGRRRLRGISKNTWPIAAGGLNSGPSKLSMRPFPRRSAPVVQEPAAAGIRRWKTAFDGLHNLFAECP